MFFEFVSIPNCYKTQEMCDRIVSENPFMIVYCPDRYQTQRVCDEAVHGCQAVLKLVCYKSNALKTWQCIIS